jgi:hypothetical protein
VGDVAALNSSRMSTPFEPTKCENSFMWPSVTSASPARRLSIGIVVQPFGPARSET